MDLQDTAAKINKLNTSARPPAGDESVFDQVEAHLQALELSEQLQIHNLLEVESLRLIYCFRERSSLDDSVLEHLIWRYFQLELTLEGNRYTDAFLNELLAEYSRRRWLAVESLVIRALKEDRLSEAQAKAADLVLTSKAYGRERGLPVQERCS
ncbi:hypothetical protein ACP26L_17305 [Paenibacillus sp. S-38]|uniref:hypothetical protein n=1 Tax=Paenibacillus sp. S-38 TaxID=3416710 RepID=UPI003CF301FF